ncbi:MAG: hypothetical protein JXR49_09890, partial [Acidobacteria bacterium]|nr:hypothetical protein [Acidobacteriota bacterium]
MPLLWFSKACVPAQIFTGIFSEDLSLGATQAMRDIVEERQRRRCPSCIVIRRMTGFYNAFYYTVYLY